MQRVSPVARTKPAVPGKRLQRAFIVEDCSSLHAPLAEILGEFATDIRVVSSCAEAAELLAAEKPPELMLLDVCLPDGTALDVLDTLAQLRHMPALVALSGASDAATAFQLAQRGVRVFVQKPICAARVREAVACSLTDAPDLTGLVRAAVGRVPIHTLEGQVRDIMLSEALARADGNRRTAARLLSVSRQLLQHMIRAKS